jgi:hypothetical protein
MDPTSLVPYLADAINALPDKWRGPVLAILVFFGAMTFAVNTLKGLVPLLDKAAQKTGAKWDNVAVARLSIFLGWMATLAGLAQLLLAALAAHKLPTMADVRSKVSSSVLISFSCMALAACASMQHPDVHRAVAAALYEPIVAAQGALHDQEAREMTALNAEALPADVFNARRAALMDRYSTADGAMSLVIEAYEAYIAAIESAGDGKDMRVEAARALLSRWHTLRDALHVLGLDVTMPEALAALGDPS